MISNGLRAGERSAVLRLRKGYVACTLLATASLVHPSIVNTLFYVGIIANKKNKKL
jgi:hypothetical protein